MQEAVNTGILSANHRSPAFVEMSRNTIQQFKDKLEVPSNYLVFFASSATECWEIIAESFIDQFSFHIYNGAFGEKWFKYRQKLANNAINHEFSPQRMLGLNALNVPQHTGLICLTQNETSNGTQVRNRLIQKIKTRYKQALICVDATSSMGGVRLAWKSADIWYASVQKCFGLPSGMAVMVCSPKAIQKALALNHNKHYNSLVFMHEKMQDWQTTYTPNILNIFLLGKVMEFVDPIKKTANGLKDRAYDFYQFCQKQGIQLLIETSRLRSDTVIVIKGSETWVGNLKAAALKEGIIFGNGYGTWKNNTFRIANFPALTNDEFEYLKVFLKKHATK
ncbi:MAG: aminotransferase class V-fold PLP-dependent enzyme [Flammeovirgaceae bacterium]